jgi:hypothetical protein
MCKFHLRRYTSHVTLTTMKKHFIILLSVTLISCQSGKKTSEDNLLTFNQFPLNVPEQNSLMTEWAGKSVLASRLIDDMESETGWNVTGIGEMSYTTERSRDGKKALRFRTSLRDEEHYRKNKTEWGSFSGTQGGNASVLLKFKEPQDWSDYNRISFWVFVHPADMMTYCLHLNIENEGTVFNATTPSNTHFIQDLKPGEWNHILFEIPHIQRNRITEFEINQMLIGHNPEENGIVTYDIDKLELQKVETDQYEGWNIAPGKISFSHIGYRPGDPKIAMAGKGAGSTFKVIDQNGKAVYSGKVNFISNINGEFQQLDFSGLSDTGIYRIQTGDIESGSFRVDENIWLQPVFKAINFFFCERCGYNVPGIHLECHKDWQGFKGEEKKIINGGWHDAGDLSQGSWRTAMATFAMMNNLEYLQQRDDVTELADRIRNEVAWGLKWLLKTRFGDGYHMSFSVMRIYTDNKPGTIDDVVSPARNVPWENFLTAAVQSKAGMMLEKTHPELAMKSRIAAIEDWQAALDSHKKWDQADYREASWGVTSSLLLAKMTGEDKYREKALFFGKLLLTCQEQKFLDGIPITGYFYENTSHTKVIHNLHAAFEEAPLIALGMLCREFPDHHDWIEWYSAVVLHSEYFMKRGSLIAVPFNNLPNSVWKESDIMSEKDSAVRNDMLRQYKDGTPLNGNYALRTFPIYRDGLFHGNTNIHMSSTWALAEASRLRKDPEGMALVGRQLEWIFGANPFGQSLMYGVGYRFAPHFAYCLKDIVGSLPVGMDCMNGDMPHWCATNIATSKEIWVEPVNRFLGAISIYANEDLNKPIGKEHLNEAEFKTEVSGTDDGTVNLKVIIKGSGRHRIDLKTFNATADKESQQFELSGNSTAETILKLKVADTNIPYVAVITLDNDPESRKEVTGAFVEPIFGK